MLHPHPALRATFPQGKALENLDWKHRFFIRKLESPYV